MVLGHMLYGAMVGWFTGRDARQASVVSPAFLRWLARQEEADRVELQPVPLTPRLRTVPPTQSRPSELPEWSVPAARAA